MGISEILAQIDREIAHLQQARALLIGPAESKLNESSGRQKGLAAKVSTATKTGVKKKRNISPAGRARIAEAAKRRWAQPKKTVASK